MHKRFDLRLSILLCLLVAAVAWVFLGPDFLGRFSINILTRSMIYAILAITVDILWGFTGVLTFEQAAFFGIGAYATAIILNHVAATPTLFMLALAAAVVIPFVAGLVVGWLSFYHGSTALYATVISLVFPIVITQLIFSGGAWTGSSSGLVGYATLPLNLANFFRLSGISLIIIAIVAFLVSRSEMGKLLMAIRDNETRLTYFGINTARIKILLMAVLAAVCGFAGFLYANSSGVVAPDDAGFGFGTELIIFTALGGRGTIFGPVLGAIGLDYLSANLSGDLPFISQLIIGSLFVVLIIFLPAGLASLVTRFLPTSKRPMQLVAAPQMPKPPLEPGDVLLAVERLSKSYGSLSVLTGIDLKIKGGELVSLVGPNGAGKTTLMRCLSDGTEAVTGRITVADKQIAGLSPERIVPLGVGRKFQVASVFESLSVGESLRLACSKKQPVALFSSRSKLVLPDSGVEILYLTGLSNMLDKPVSLLSHGQRQALELAMVICLEPSLVLLDEPTAGLTKTERMMIGKILRKLTDEMGYAAILVEHDLDFVREISSRIVVLHQGKLVLDGTVEDVVNSEEVSAIYSGGGHG